MDEIEAGPDDTKFGIPRMAEFLRSGSDSQRTVILFELQHLLDHCFEETMNLLVPVLCEQVGDWCFDLQLSAAEALVDVIQKPIPRRVSKLICDAAFQVVTRSRTGEIFEAWGEILVVVLPNAHWEGNYEISSVISLLDDFALSTDEICRKLVARVLGSLSVCLSTGEVETYVLNRALHLADDSDIDVRGMVAESLAFIGAVVDVQVAETIVWPKLLCLLNDPDARIHAATLRTIAHILEAHQEDRETSPLFKTLLPPVFAKECQFARRAAEADQRKVDDDTYLLLEIFSEVFGPLLFAAHPFFADEEEKAHAFDAFLAMSTCNGPIVRRYCAFNLPGVAKSLLEGYTTELAGITEFLSRDSDSETRWNLAAGIHATCRVLMGKGSSDNLFQTVIALLQDKNPLVRMNALEHFSELLSSLSNENDASSMRKLTRLFQNLTLLSEGNWRTQELLAKQLEKTSQLVPPDCLRANVLPLLRSMAEESTYLVRRAAMLAIAKTIWCLPSPSERQAEMNDFISDWGEGGVYWMRIAYIDCAQAAVKVFSANLFEVLFAQPLFRLAQDGVVNVRLRLASMIHETAPSCYSHIDFRNAVESLRQDTDIDVRSTMEGVDARIENELRDMDYLKREDGKREEAEREIQNRRELLKTEGRRRGTKAKVRASTLLLRIGSKSQTTSLQQGNTDEASPTCITQVVGNGERGHSIRSGLTLPGSSKTSESMQSGAGNEGDSLLLSPQKSLKNIFGLVRNEPGASSTPGRRAKEASKHVTTGDLGSPSSSGSPRKSLKNPFWFSGDELGAPPSPSPKRDGKTLAGLASDGPASPSAGSRKGLKNLLTVVSGNRNRP